jgi:hypothetical protein
MFYLSIQSCGFVGTQIEPRLRLILVFSTFASFSICNFGYILEEMLLAGCLRTGC